MKILAISDIHGKTDCLEDLLKLVKENKIEVALFTGDVVKGKARGDEWLSALKENRKPGKSGAIVDEAKEDEALFVKFFRWFDSNRIHVATIPGNMDAPLSRYYKIINYKLNFSTYLHQVHEGFWTYGGFVFSGFGGAIDERKEEYFVFQSPPEEMMASLMVEKEMGKLVFLFHQPPTGGTDQVGDTERGHPSVNEIIEKHQPELAFVGHSHVQSSQKIGKTLVINPGALKKGHVAIVDLETKVFEHVKL